MDVNRFREILEKRTSYNSKTDCWEYLGTNSDGYGQVMIDKQFYYVHNLSAQLFLNYIPLTGLMICYKPECSSKSCWNPEHLYIGTAKENNQDMIRAGNARGKYSDVTHCVNGHEFTQENTYWYQKSDLKVRRQCRECKKIQDQKSKQEKKFLKFGHS